MESKFDGQTVIADFLEVCIHTILYSRDVYPAAIFEAASRFGKTVRISRHPELNDYISRVIKSIHSWLRPGALHKVVVVLYDRPNNHGQNKNNASSSTPSSSSLPSAASSMDSSGQQKSKFHRYEPYPVLERFVFDLQLCQNLTLDDNAIKTIQHSFSYLLTLLDCNGSKLADAPKGRCSWTVLLYTNEYKLVNEESFVGSVNNAFPQNQQQREAQRERDDTWRFWVPEENQEHMEISGEYVIHPIREIVNDFFNLRLFIEESSEYKMKTYTGKD